jgi:hypothetical protein
LSAFGWGLRALFGPATYMLLALIAARAARAAWRLAVRFIPPITRATLAFRRRWRDTSRRAGLVDRSRLAPWLLAGQILGLAIFVWSFRDLIGSFGTFLNDAPAGNLRRLAYENNVHFAYRTVLSILVLMMIMGWRSLLARPVERAPVDRVTTASGIALIVVALVLLALPFRLVNHSIFQAVDLEGKRCYVTGEQGNDVLLFCPESIPRVRTVPVSDPALRHRGVFERIFR